LDRELMAKVGVLILPFAELDAAFVGHGVVERVLQQSGVVARNRLLLKSEVVLLEANHAMVLMHHDAHFAGADFAAVFVVADDFFLPRDFFLIDVVALATRVLMYELGVGVDGFVVDFPRERSEPDALLVAQDVWLILPLG